MYQFRMYHTEKFDELLKRSSKVEFERVLDKKEYDEQLTMLESKADFHSKQNDVETAFKYLRQLQIFHSQVSPKDQSEDFMVKFDKSIEVYKKISRMWYRVRDKFDQDVTGYEKPQNTENLLAQGHQLTDEFDNPFAKIFLPENDENVEKLKENDKIAIKNDQNVEQNGVDRANYSPQFESIQFHENPSENSSQHNKIEVLSVETIPLQKPSCELIKSQKGREKLLCDGFLYIFDKNLKSGEIVWRCEMRKNSKFFCKATIYTEDEGTQKFVKFGNSHTHERNLGSYERQKIANKVKNFASESSEKASKIHKKLKSQLDREEVKIAGSDGAVRRKIQRCKGKIKRIS